MTSTARLLLDRLVDYAGLFPPAGLTMPDAVARYAASQAGPHAWMLGRFVVPATRLPELVDAAARMAPAAGRPAWSLSVLLGDVGREAALLSAAMPECRAAGLPIAAVEMKADTGAAVESLVQKLPASLEPWFEIAPGPSLGSTLLAIAQAGGGAKLRMGGVTPSAFPSSSDVARFVLACARGGVRFKATAGLHHAVRGSFRVTYADDSPRATMHGFVNVFLAAALAHVVCRGGCPDPEAETQVAALLDETHPGALLWQDAGVRWRSQWLGADAIAESRASLACSFGSCSFDEPVADLQRLALIDAC